MSEFDWSLPESWLEEDATQRQIAAAFRAEADMFKARYYEMRDEGSSPELVHAIHISMYDAIGRAAAIERRIRNIEYIDPFPSLAN